MLFAAGLGTRLRPYTDLHPKPVLPLLGCPLGYYILPHFDSIEISNLVVNTFHLPDQVHQLYENCQPALRLKEKIRFSDEKDFIKGSAGGLKQAEDLLCLNTENILVCNSDEVFFPLEKNFLNAAFEEHQEKEALATLIVTKHPLAGSKFGAIWTDAGGRVIGIGKEAPQAQAEPWHFIGLQIFSQSIFEYIPEHKESNIFYDVLVHLLQKEWVQIYPIQADWYETGNKTDYLEAKKEITEKLKTEIRYQKQFARLSDFSKLARLQISDLA